tara:strand:- start:2693 stop:5716 length:3024 start_codon:yes stop_codon:yes gene_type:complete
MTQRIGYNNDMNWFKLSQGQQDIMVSGPGVDIMLTTVSNMLALGAPVQLDEIGGSGVSYPVFYDIAAKYGPGGEVPWPDVIKTMNALKIHKNTQVPNYEEIREVVIEDYERAKGQQPNQPEPSGDPKKIIFMGEIQVPSGQRTYKKLDFQIRNLARYPKVKDAIRNEMQKRVDQGQRHFQSRVDNYGREDFPIFMAMTRSKQNLDSFTVDPSFVAVIEPPLREMGYDTSDMLSHVEAAQQQTQLQNKIEVKIDGRTLTMDFNGFPGRDGIQAAKDAGLRGRKEGEKWLWYTPEPDLQALGDFSVFMKERGFDTTALVDALMTLEEEFAHAAEEGEEGGDINIEVRDITGETADRWHLGVKFLRKGTYEGETLKQILKYSFVSWADSPESTQGVRTINKDTWETYVAGNMQEYVHFINSLNNRGYNSQPVSDILQSLMERGLVEPMEGIGFLDGYESRDEFFRELDNYNLPFELYPEQKEGIAKQYSHKAFLKGDETGAGKSVQAILSADMRTKQSGGRTVIFTKNRVVPQYMEAIAGFLGVDPEDRSQISSNPLDKPRFTVLSYTKMAARGGAEALPGELNGREAYTQELINQAQSGEIQCCVLDESHTVKNGTPASRAEPGRRDHKSNHTTFNVQDVTEHIPFVWGNSATVVANKAVDVYNQLKAVNHPLGRMPYGRFAVEFGGMVRGRYGLEDGPIEDQLEAVNRLKEFMFDQNVYDALSKKQLNENMPDQIINEDVVNVDQKELWKNIADRLKTVKNPDLPVTQMQVFRNHVAIAKAPITVENAKEVLDQGKKLMIFTDFTASLKTLQKGVNEYFQQRGQGETSVKISGGMKDEKVEAAIKAFKDPGNSARVLIANIIAGGTGLDFPNVTQDVLVNDFDWSIAADEQMLGRAYRINSEEDVNVKYTIAGGTPDEDYYQRLSEKKQVADIIHKMSMEQDALFKGGHRRGRSKQLKQLETKLNEMKKRYIAMESRDKDFERQVGEEIGSHVRQASSGHWYNKVVYN